MHLIIVFILFWLTVCAVIVGVASLLHLLTMPAVALALLAIAIYANLRRILRRHRNKTRSGPASRSVSLNKHSKPNR